MNVYKKLLGLLTLPNKLYAKLDSIQQSIGRIEYRQLQPHFANMKNLQEVEYKVFSQWGDDGIIQYLVHTIPIDRKVFVEFGVENYLESNTRYLLQNNNWAGLIIDGSQKNINYIKNDPFYWKYNLKAECAFIDRDNIDSIISSNGVTGDIGILSIDIDGNDFWIWQSIDCVSPRIVICEYNSYFGPCAKVTIPYDKNFIRTKAHYSNLYWGASIGALEDLAQSKGYSLIGSNSAGNNVYFIRKDVQGKLPTLSSEEAYVKSQFRESRDSKNKLTYLIQAEGVSLISEMPVFDLTLKKTVMLKDSLTK